METLLRWLPSGPSSLIIAKDPGKPLRAYSLKLREQFSRLKGRSDHGLGEGDTLLRDQFVLGLRDGPVRQSIRLQLRRDSTLTFEALRQEALALEVDQGETIEPPVCTVASGACAPIPSETIDWRQKLRKELLADVKGQMVELSRSLVEELRRGRPSNMPMARDRSYSDGNREPRHRPARSVGLRFQWDDQGRPICNSCGEPGHISRQCGPRRGSQGGF